MNLIYHFMKVFYTLLYHPFAWSYDWVASLVSLNQWQNWIQVILPYLEGQYILELGPGPGHLQKNLSQQNLHVFGLDESPQMLKRTAQRLHGHKLVVRLIRGLAEDMPFQRASFDSLFATFPAAFILSQKTALEAARVLKPGGRLVVLAAAWITGRSLPARLTSLLYLITGQSSPDEKQFELFLAPYRQAGFEIEIKKVPTPSAMLWLLVGTRLI
jgi:ubiquinone/menaquinone biosynthesis C-methylase UbiE